MLLTRVLHMKNILILGVICLVGIAHAAPVGNPAFPKILEEGFIFSPASKFSIRLGYEGNFVLDKRLKKEKNPFTDINKFTLFENSGIATLNLLNRLDLFGTYGEGRIDLDWINEEGKNILSYFQVQSKYDPAWSCGTKIIFFEWGKVNFSAGGRYFYTKPTVCHFSKNAASYPTDLSNLKLHEWQIDLGLSYKTCFLVPYICGKYSKTKAFFSIEDEAISSDGSKIYSLEMKNKNAGGMAIGCTFSNGKYFMLNAEARLFDEEAFTVSGEFKF